MDNSNDEIIRIETLFNKFYLDTATKEEVHELAVLIHKHDEEGLIPVLKNTWTNEKPDTIFSEEQSDAIFNRVIENDQSSRTIPIGEDVKGPRIFTFKRTAIAAAVIGILVLGYFMLTPPVTKVPVAVTKTDSVTHDISPGRNGGILILSNGKEILLDDQQNGTVANEGQVKVVKKDGQLTYEAQGAEATLFNTLRTPRGRQYHLILSDGSGVWLNASSSISYPTNFSGNERTVEVTGEAYFEVAHDPSKPFKVKLHDGSNIQVLGTHFNVNSYEDAGNIKTTLLEGSVRVIIGADKLRLEPGQQAIANNNALKVAANVDVEEVMAWKNGFFAFQKASLKTIMRELSRWYDVDVVYEGNVPEVSFSGEIGRKLTLKQVLSILDETRIHYRIEGRKLIITP